MPQLCTFGASSARGFGLTEETGLTNDEQFNLTTLLLPGNGTNGAQNNTFLDSSTNNLTITRNGNTTQGTFSPFSFGGGTEQANGYYSGYFDGTGDYLNKTSGTITLSGDFTLEYWMYPTSVGSYPTTYSTFNAIAVASAMYAQFALNGTTFTFSCGNGSSDGVIGSYTATLNQWQHHAIVRSGTTVTAYVNGVSVGTRTSSVAFNLTSLGIGAYTGALAGTYPFFGYISNFRIVNGTALYTSNFTVPTTPLTAVTNTALLTCQSSQFIDNSTNAFSITVNGNAQPVTTNPFGMTDWSGYFDGTGDYLSVASNAAFALGTGDFCIEGWYFVYTNKDYNIYFDFRNGSGTAVVPYFYSTSTGDVDYFVNGGSRITGSGSIKAGQWSHIAVIRSGTATKLFINGAQIGSTYTDSNNYAQGPVYIGRNNGGGTTYDASYYCSNFRVVKGTTGGYGTPGSTITVPTTPLTNITNTSLLTCQSSQFIDNSTNAFAITVNGNPYTLTLNNPFNSPVNYTTPPLQAWSNYLNGGSDRLSNASASVMDVGTGNFTIEMWVFLTSTANQMFFEGSGNAGLQVVIESGVLFGGLSGTAAPVTYTLPSGFTNTWHHIAYVREGTGSNQVSLYVDGIRRSQGTLSNSVTTTGFQISRTTTYLVYGYISNLRVVKNSAVYTGATITVPTAPLTAIANTSLLTCQSNNFVDNSINRCAITVSGSTSVQPFSPFQPAAPYSTTSVGGSGYFDGSGDYLTVADNTAFEFGSGDFNLEGWFYALSVASDTTIVSKWTATGTANSNSWLLFVTSGVATFLTSTNGSAVDVNISGGTVTVNSWNHIAVSRSGNTYSLYLNGTRTATTTNSNSLADVATVVAIGRYSGGTFGYMNGYISNARIVKGTAVYTSAFTPPPAPLTAVTNTSLLLNYTNAGIPDATAKNVLETVGNAQISTAQSKFGGSSMAFDGSGDALILPASQNLALETGNFTIEMWVYGANNGGTVGGSYPRLFSLGTVQTTGSIESYNAAGTLYVEIFGSSITFTASTLLNSSWNHFAISRSGSSVKAFVNGTQVGSTLTNSTNLNRAASSTSIIGASTASTGNFNGYIDDLRITKGYARYTANFTPPTQAFPLF